ncbi:MAG: TetR family transcriptional regulator [Xanthomonadaceae bacterium]|jgi:AcrR family transcriptional regulator|nr:TetR family transcriptional regulator [Xanthomonadaceae bacterium]
MDRQTSSSTKDRILSAAEELFAQQGFAGTSLRQVTGKANVNIAAVNYHFGSKENLINEVFRKRMDEMSSQRLAQLDQALSHSPVSLEAILAAFIEPPLALAQGDAADNAFVRIIARAYAENIVSLRHFLHNRYGHVLHRFAIALSECLPSLGKEELYWRLDFVAGALTYAMADFGSAKYSLDAAEPSFSPARTTCELIRFASAGLRATSSPTSATRGLR